MNEIRARGLDEGPFKAAVLGVIAQIPAGKVADQADIAESLGYPRDAVPLVGWVIAGTSDPSVPWHRVICEDGSLPELPGRAVAEQVQLLGSEGVELEDGPRVDIDTYRWKPEPRPFRGPIASYR